MCEKSKAIALAQPGLTAGSQSASPVSQAVRQSDKIVLNLKFFKIIYWINSRVFAMFNKGTVLL